MLIEKDEAQVRSGIRWGETIGAPVALGIENRDWKTGQKNVPLPEDRDDKIAVTKPRPGHADLNGALKYDRRDIRDILERASARETVARTGRRLVRQAIAGTVSVFASWLYSFHRQRPQRISRTFPSMRFTRVRKSHRCEQPIMLPKKK